MGTVCSEMSGLWLHKFNFKRWQLNWVPTELGLSFALG